MTQLNLINLKTVFVYEIGVIALREVSPPFDEEQLVRASISTT